MNKILSFVICLGVFGFVNGQTEGQDAQLWGYFKIEKKISKHWSAFLNLKGRAINNMMVPGRGAADMGFAYKFSKNIRAHLDYQYVQKLGNKGSYVTWHQFRAALILKKDIDHWSFIYRNMLQARSKGIFNGFDNYNIRYYDRNKL